MALAACCWEGVGPTLGGVTSGETLLWTGAVGVLTVATGALGVLTAGVEGWGPLPASAMADEVSIGAEVRPPVPRDAGAVVVLFGVVGGVLGAVVPPPVVVVVGGTGVTGITAGGVVAPPVVVVVLGGVVPPLLGSGLGAVVVPLPGGEVGAKVVEVEGLPAEVEDPVVSARALDANANSRAPTSVAIQKPLVVRTPRMVRIYVPPPPGKLPCPISWSFGE